MCFCFALFCFVLTYTSFGENVSDQVSIFIFLGERDPTSMETLFQILSLILSGTCDSRGIPVVQLLLAFVHLYIYFQT